MRWIAALGLVAVLAACGPSQEADRAAAQGVLHALYDKPGQTLESGPTAIEGNIAVVDWTQGDMGGRALLQRHEGKWTLLLCSGDPLRTAEGLQGVGVPPAAAKTLARKLQEAEAGIAPQRLSRMASFRGVVRMDGHPAHGEKE